MTVTMDELEKFVEVFHEQEIQKIKTKDLKKAVRHYWNVASDPTVQDRINTLVQEGWIEPVQGGKEFKIKEDAGSSIEKLFRERGEREQ